MSFATIKYFALSCLLLTGLSSNAQVTGSTEPPVSTDSTVVTTPAPIVLEQTWLIDPAIIQPRLLALQKEIPLTYNATIHQFVEYFAYRKPSFTKTMLERKGVYFPIYEKYLKKYGLPDELKYLSLIESGLNPKVISRAGAGGLWQFMPKTARVDFGLRIDEYVDERFDPETATEAACKYMKQLYRIFGDWHLVLAAYNTGPGNVRRAIRRCNGGQTFWAIYDCLPRETRGYVPQYIGMLYMINHAESHDIFPENIETAIAHDTIHVNSYLDLDRLASLSSISLEEIQKLNPQILTHILPGYTRNFALRLPKNDMAFFKANRLAILDSATKLPPVFVEMPAQTAEVYASNNTSNDDKPIVITTPIMGASTSSVSSSDPKMVVEHEIIEDDIEDVVINKKPKKQYYVVRKKDNLTEIADKFDVELYDLKVWNHLQKSTIQPGQKLVILKEKAITSQVKYARSNAREKESIKKGKTKFYSVQSGDTLWNISQRYGGISIDKLKKLNGIKGNVVKAGMKIRVS
jgi:membrane-bound lytic murein transglycosylase D